MRLTGAGHALAARAGEVLDVLSAARADLDRLGGAPGGPVTIAAVASAALRFVSVAADRLALDHPDIRLRVEVAEPARALALLRAGDVELALVDEYDYVPLALPDSVVAHPLTQESLVLVTPEGWHGAAEPALAALAGERWVMPPDDAACGQAVRSACRAAGFEPDVRWTTDDMLVLARAVGGRPRGGGPAAALGRRRRRRRGSTGAARPPADPAAHRGRPGIGAGPARRRDGAGSGAGGGAGGGPPAAGGPAHARQTAAD